MTHQSEKRYLADGLSQVHLTEWVGLDVALALLS